MKLGRNACITRLHAILESGEYVSIKDLNSFEDYTFAPIYNDQMPIGYDLPPSMIDSIWCQRVCGYCIKPTLNFGCLTSIIPPSWGGSKRSWNHALACEECLRIKKSKTGWSTFDGREGVYWDGSSWRGEKNPRPKFARDREVQEFVSFTRRDVETILPHRFMKPAGL
ncbi:MULTISPECIES: hypothetical protein [unclassified Rhizobium]|uniref:hypothetical protein n=1 Tax=unclassified Rhizobium TaxID=2613769 RepID=UPI001AE28883|nr:MULTISPECIES: hypothetical protein [unclassified Rhizobium]MBP2463913.1 hypothetical protein [Rhizobium sp. PvP014]